MKKIIAGFGALVVALTLVGCGTTASTVENPAQPETTTVPEAASEPETQTPPPVDDMIFQFGETIEYEDGLGLSVSAPQPYTPTQYAAGGDAPNNIVFNVKITNNTTAPYEPGVYGTLASGGAEASQIFDTANGLDGGPMTPVLPGQTVEWAVGFNVIDPADLTYSVSPSFDYNAAIFTTVLP